MSKRKLSAQSSSCPPSPGYLKRNRSGNKAVSASIMPHGPNSRFNTPAEMTEWPVALCNLAFKGPVGAVRKTRFEQLSQGGFELSTDFTGKYSVEVALGMLGVAFEMKKLDVPANWLLIWRGCDINTTTQKIAMCGKKVSRRRWTGLATSGHRCKRCCPRTCEII